MIGIWGYSFLPYLIMSVPALLPFFWLRVVLFIVSGSYQALVVNRQLHIACAGGESKSAMIVRIVVIVLACFVLGYCLCYAYGSANSTDVIDIVPEAVDGKSNN
jgi:hypothetical protein